MQIKEEKPTHSPFTTSTCVQLLVIQPKKMEAAATTIVMYPSPGMGHIVSMVELAKLLQQHFSNITILLTTGLHDNPSIDSYINRISTSHPSISFLRFPTVTVTHTNTQSFAATAFRFIKTNAVNVKSALRQISQSSTIKSVVIDLFCTSAMESTSSMGIPVYYFFTSGAAVLALYSYFPEIHRKTTTSFKDMAGVEIVAPGNAALNAALMPEPVLDREDPAYWEMVYFCEHLSKAKGIVVNTFRELEPTAVKAVEEGACFPDHTGALPPPVYCIGPLIADPQQPAKSDEARDSKDCLSWLDKQPRRSVVYLCFGSRGSFSVAQLKEIAEGLERSGHRFLWVVKRPIQEHDGTNQVHDATGEFELASVLPSGFIERTKERGLVVSSWAPQVEVLSRESVGGFVSHCGWNSVLEGVVAGVPMIAWPLYAEQHVNRNVMVKEMKVAVGVEQRDGDGFVSGKEVERTVRELMESERGKEIRERSLKIKDMARNALGEFGSSTKALANLVQTWNGITN